MPHRESVSAYLRGLHIEDASIVDWGRGTKPVTNYITQTNCTYTGIDKLSHVGADIVRDICEQGLLMPDQQKMADLGWDESVLGNTDDPEPGLVQYDVAFCMEVLEHVQYPIELLLNIDRHLKIGGVIHMSVPFLYPVHSEEDYWRFTDQGLRLLLVNAGFQVEMIEPTEQNAGWIARAVRT